MNLQEGNALRLNDRFQKGSSQNAQHQSHTGRNGQHQQNAAVLTTALLLLSLVLPIARPQSAQAACEGRVQRFTCNKGIAEFYAMPDLCQQSGVGCCGIGSSDKMLFCLTVAGVSGSAGLDVTDLFGRDTGEFQRASVFVLPADDRVLSSMRIIFEMIMPNHVLKTISVPVQQLEIRKTTNIGYYIQIKAADFLKPFVEQPVYLRRMVIVLDSGPQLQSVCIGQVGVEMTNGRQRQSLNPSNILFDDEGCGALIK